MERLKSVLEETADGGRVLTVQPGGNPGDTLIYRGFSKLAESADFEQVPLRPEAVRSDSFQGFPSSNLTYDFWWLQNQGHFLRHRLFSGISAVYVHGGGNFNDIWEAGIYCYATAARYFDCPIVVGPQSCLFTERDPRAVFEGVDNETHFFCREQYSHDIMEETTADLDHVTLHFEDDTALFVEAEDLPVTSDPAEYTLLAMRMDKDSASPLIEKDIDGPILVRDTSNMDESFEAWVDSAARAERIFTDRLHVAILASILGTPVEWYDTGFHKNRGVYEYSLSDNPDVHFHG